jgi:hypothetical protein
MRYSLLAISCEKRPDPSSPTRLAPFSLAALLALASSEEGTTPVSMLKVFAINILPSVLMLKGSDDNIVYVLGA